MNYSKKNPKFDVGRNSSLYFAIGLVLMLLVSNYAINYTTYDQLAIIGDELRIGPDELEEIPITKPIEELPPPKPEPVIPEDIDEVDDEEDVEESLIDTTETDQDDVIPDVDVEDVNVVEEEEDLVVPFSVIENVPVFPGCETGTNEQKRQCMSDKINKFIGRKFNTDLADELGLSGTMVIISTFKINKNGDIIEVRSRAPHPKLAQEAERVIKLLPKMKPGKQRGEAVIVPYQLPIRFKVQN